MLASLPSREINRQHGSIEPVVTHGHTFCTVVLFEDVAKAIGYRAASNTTIRTIWLILQHYWRMWECGKSIGSARRWAAFSAC